MEAALGGGGGGGGASWGLMGPDAEWEEGEGPGGEGLDWRMHVERGTLTDKQMKLVDKIRWVPLGLRYMHCGMCINCATCIVVCASACWITSLCQSASSNSTNVLFQKLGL